MSGARAKATFDLDTVSASAKMDSLNSKISKAGGEFAKSSPVLGKMLTTIGSISGAMGALSLVTQQWNKELEKGRQIIQQTNDINSIAGIGGTLPQSPEFRMAIDESLGKGTLGREQLVELAGGFKGQARKATAQETGMALGQFQKASRAQFSWQEMVEIGRGTGILKRAGFSTDQAANIASSIVRESGALASEVIDAISEIASLAGKEEALALLPYFLGAGDKAVVSTYTSEAAQLAEKGMRSGIASMVPFTDEVRKNAQQYTGQFFGNYLDQQVAIAESDKLIEKYNFVGMDESFMQKYGKGSNRAMNNALEDRMTQSFRNYGRENSPDIVSSMLLELGFAMGLDNYLVDENYMQKRMKQLSKDNAIPVVNADPPMLKPNGQE